MANANSAIVRHRTISDYGLSRLCHTPLGGTRFMRPYISPPDSFDYYGSWDASAVMQNDELLSWYGVAPSLNAYITFEVFLTKEEQIGAERTTSMRYRDMMVDNYLAGGGDLKTWKYIGVERIVHRGTRIMIEGCFHQDSNLFSAGGALELRPSDSEFACMALKNPFTRGIQRLLREYESEVANARIRRVIFISMGVVNDFSLHPESNPMLNMVVELCRPGEDGYPDC